MQMHTDDMMIKLVSKLYDREVSKSGRSVILGAGNNFYIDSDVMGVYTYLCPDPRGDVEYSLLLLLDDRLELSHDEIRKGYHGGLEVYHNGTYIEISKGGHPFCNDVISLLMKIFEVE